MADSCRANRPLLHAARRRRSGTLRHADSVNPSLEGVSAAQLFPTNVPCHNSDKVTRVPPGYRGGDFFGEHVTTLTKGRLIIEAVFWVLKYLMKSCDVDAVGPGNMPQGELPTCLYNDNGGVVVSHDVDACLSAED